MIHSKMHLHSVSRALMTVAFCVLLFACNTTRSLEIPTIAAVEPKSFAMAQGDQASFVLAKIVSGIRRGTTIAAFPGTGVDGADGILCNYKHGPNSTIEWSSGSAVFGNWSTELGEIFFDSLFNAGINVKGDPKQLFEQTSNIQGAEYQIAGRITDMQGNFCQQHNFWTALPEELYSGEMFVTVEWTIRSSVTNRNIAQIETSGYFLQKPVKRNGMILALHNAFGAAAEGLIEQEAFIDLATRKNEGESDEVKGAPIQLTGIPLSRKPFASRPSQITDSVVTIRVGQSHGSGFFFSDDGYILTNEHVVADADRVGVILSNGFELEGTVVRRHRRRDVAIIKVPIRAQNALPVRFKPVEVLEEVYAIGSPGLETLQSTVTGGVVSAMRYWEKEGIEMIQSDVAISGGNSGGAFVDKNGNVVGISVAGYVFPGAQNLNLFIPIGDALETLKINISSPGS